MVYKKWNALDFLLFLTIMVCKQMKEISILEGLSIFFFELTLIFSNNSS
jgi:hypothetical protein